MNCENFKQMSGEQLCEAAKQGQKEAVTQLIRSGVDVNATDSEGRTALHWSVERTKFAVVKELLDLSARIDMLDGRSESPVHIAVRNCQGPSDTIGKMMVNVLLQRYTGPKKQLVDLQSATGDTCVHIAVRAGNETVLQALVKHRPNLELPNNANETPRSLAASQSPAIQQLVGGAAPPPASPAARPQSAGRGRAMPAPPTGVSEAPVSQYVPPAQSAPARAGQLDMPVAQLSDQSAAPPGQVRASEAGGVQASLQALQAHIKRLFDNDGFEEEFEYLESLTATQIQNEDFTTALYPHNKEKNRYTNILPFERTRVVLGPVEGLVGSDYVNANYMSGEVPGSHNAYIAAQGPKEVTVFDFWRMVYELKLSVIVMLGTNIEDGKIKFWQYWPENNGAIDIGYFRVTFVSEESFFGEVYLRRYVLTNTYTNEQNEVCHLKYTAFPDHGVPDNTNGFLKLISVAEEEAVRLGEKRGTGRRPIVVHCSAGVGRTGTYIAVAVTIAKLNYASAAAIHNRPPIQLNFNVLDTLVQLRRQRPGMVQTKEQLIYCYLAILEKVITHCNILDFQNERWFNKISAHEAINVLTAAKSGTFLFRPSSAPGYLSMSYNKESVIHHVRIQVTSDGFICEGDEIVYTSLQALVDNKRAVLQSAVYAY